MSDTGLLFLARGLRLFAYGFLSVVLALYLSRLGLSEFQIGLLLTLTLVGDTAISLWITTRADRAGRRVMLIAGAGLMVLAAALFAATHNFALLLLAATVGVISPSGYEVGPFLSIEQAALAQLVSSRQRTAVFAWYNLVGSFATALGALASGGLVQVLHGGARALGILMSAVGVGALSGALLLATRSSVRGLGRWVGAAAAGFGISMAAFAFSPFFWLSAALLIPTGAFMMVQMAASNTLVQAMVPDHLRGRVMALYSMMFMGMAPFGAFFAGVVAEHIGAPWTVAIGGLGCIVGSIAFGYRLPELRAEARQLIIAQQMAGGDPPQEMTAPVRGMPEAVTDPAAE